MQPTGYIFSMIVCVCTYLILTLIFTFSSLLATKCFDQFMLNLLTAEAE